MRLTRRQLRRTVRRVLKESLMSHMDGNIMNIILYASQQIGEEYGDIVVDDVLKRIQQMSDEEIISNADPARYPAEHYNPALIDAVRQLDYNMVVDQMWELVELGELADGYEDFFSLPGV